MKKFINLFKSKNYVFEDGTQILFSGQGGLTYVAQNGKKIFFPWLREDNFELYKQNKNIDLFIEINKLKWYSENWKKTDFFNSIGSIDKDGNKIFTEKESKELINFINSHDWNEDIDMTEKQYIIENLLFYCKKFNINYQIVS